MVTPDLFRGPAACPVAGTGWIPEQVRDDSEALAWINAQAGIAAPIASARTPDQLDALLEGATLELGAEHLAKLTAARA